VKPRSILILSACFLLFIVAFGTTRRARESSAYPDESHWQDRDGCSCSVCGGGR
jgi:hypothetical protein